MGPYGGVGQLVLSKCHTSDTHGCMIAELVLSDVMFDQDADSSGYINYCL